MDHANSDSVTREILSSPFPRRLRSLDQLASLVMATDWVLGAVRPAAISLVVTAWVSLPPVGID